MRKWVKEAFSRKLIFTVYIPSIILIILGCVIKEVWDISIIVSAAVFLFKILIFRISIWILLAVALVGLILYRIKRRVLDERQKFILSILDDREVGLTNLAVAYKKLWPKDGRIKTKSAEILKSLERLKLAESRCSVGGANTVQEEMIKATDKGKKRIKKIETVVLEKAEKIFDEVYREAISLEPMDEEIEHNMEDIFFILGILAHDEAKEALKTRLRFDYTNQFRDKDMAHFNYIWSILERKRLIEEKPTGYAGSYTEIPFLITDKGLQLYHREKVISGN